MLANELQLFEDILKCICYIHHILVFIAITLIPIYIKYLIYYIKNYIYYNSI